jgi:hypothetical protein
MKQTAGIGHCTTCYTRKPWSETLLISVYDQDVYGQIVAMEQLASA